MPTPANTEFDIRGVNHIALVCRDMARTVEFYRDILGMPLVKTIELPMKSGQHFFFDIGNGDCLAFFWFPDAPANAPGVSSPRTLPHEGGLVTAHGSMNHLAFNVPVEKFDAYVERLKAKGIEVSPVSTPTGSAWSSPPGPGPWGPRTSSTRRRRPMEAAARVWCWTPPAPPSRPPGQGAEPCPSCARFPGPRSALT